MDVNFFTEVVPEGGLTLQGNTETLKEPITCKKKRNDPKRYLLRRDRLMLISKTKLVLKCHQRF